MKLGPLFLVSALTVSAFVLPTPLWSESEGSGHSLSPSQSSATTPPVPSKRECELFGLQSSAGPREGASPVAAASSKALDDPWEGCRQYEDCRIVGSCDPFCQCVGFSTGVCTGRDPRGICLCW